MFHQIGLKTILYTSNMYIELLAVFSLFTNVISVLSMSTYSFLLFILLTYFVLKLLTRAILMKSVIYSYDFFIVVPQWVKILVPYANHHEMIVDLQEPFKFISHCNCLLHLITKLLTTIKSQGIFPCFCSMSSGINCSILRSN